MGCKGRGSALVVATLVLVALMLQTEVCSAVIYPVGGRTGWTFNMAKWPRTKSFKANDVLVFNYNPGFHNVVRVSKAGYRACTTPKGALTFQTGKDRIKLTKGINYFICSIPGHCQAGMKMAIKAF